MLYLVCISTGKDEDRSLTKEEEEEKKNSKLHF
jgi:hypothetical protein